MTQTQPVSQYFGCNTFNERVMRERLSKEVLLEYERALKTGAPLSPDIAQAVAQAMKDWAISRGCTHYSHWFLPMTGATAEKHDAFIAWDKGFAHVIEKFSGGQLIQGEPDASSFPSGGLRATFEARGYTAWDPSSPAFIVDGTLCIPTAFVGYHGEALDHKVPLLRSIARVARAATAALECFGVKNAQVQVYCGPEQEYFLVEQALYRKRPDLLFASRTLQGARPPKGQEMEDHYFGSIKPRVLAFMKEVEEECFRLGIPAKTRHNEVAPNQFEIAPIFEPAAIASDHNQLLMELLRKVAERHGFAVLLHEKPFAGVNGSGKHVNWSLGTTEPSSGQSHNLLEPGKTPEENLTFLFFLAACLRAIHSHGAVLRAAVASAGNDHRMGANEAPPAIMSAYLGSRLNQILDSIESGVAADASSRGILDLGIGNLPHIEKDATDRNRTSPFAFTGNKFEFRAVGSSQPIAFPLTVINAAVAESLEEMVSELKVEDSRGQAPRAAAMAVIRNTIRKTKSIRFEGNGYSEDWAREAERRGLPVARDTVAALEYWEREATRKLFVGGAQNTILHHGELEARVHIRHEQYQKTLAIEAQVLVEMAETMLLPAVFRDINLKAKALKNCAKLDILEEVPGAVPPVLKLALRQELLAAGTLKERCEHLKKMMTLAEGAPDYRTRTHAWGREVVPVMRELRDTLDVLEKDCAADLWPVPPYRELLSPL